MKYSYKTMAKLVANRISREELIQLAELLDADGGNDFCHFIQGECAKVAPELYADPETEKSSVTAGRWR